MVYLINTMYCTEILEVNYEPANRCNYLKKFSNIILLINYGENLKVVAPIYYFLFLIIYSARSKKQKYFFWYGICTIIVIERQECTVPTKTNKKWSATKKCIT